MTRFTAVCRAEWTPPPTEPEIRGTGLGEGQVRSAQDMLLIKVTPSVVRPLLASAARQTFPVCGTCNPDRQSWPRFLARVAATCEIDGLRRSRSPPRVPGRGRTKLGGPYVILTNL